MEEGNEVDVVAGILRVAAEGATKTNIVYRCNLDLVVIDDYLYALMGLNLLRSEERAVYRTTEKGLRLLQVYHKLKWLLWGRTFDFLLIRLLSRLLSNHQRHERPVSLEDSG